MLSGKRLFAYTAGIIDGEGTIGLRNNNKPADTSKPRYYVIRVAVGNTNEWLIQMLKMQFGGHISLIEKLKPNKPLWTWEICSRKAASFLKLVLPYLQIKRPQAELALAFQERKIKGHTSHKSTVLDQVDKILMAQLNKRGLKKEEKR